MKKIDKLIAQAIQDRHCLAIRYRGQEDIRVIEPHALYLNERDELTVDGFQLRGFSASGRPAPFWRPFRVKKITAINVLPDHFTPRVAEGYSANKKRYQRKLLMAAEESGMHFTYAIEELHSMGPPKPQFARRYF
ncbi:MAG: WYL domain-containing protein [Gammaproteobacteria bacterium]|nr:WYL domain-containing protein [Gammaproteobacteria bacterium]